MHSQMAVAPARPGPRAACGLGFVDRLIHAEYRKHADEMLTCEKAAGRLTGTRVLV
jgi:hypothetical protein